MANPAKRFLTELSITPKRLRRLWLWIWGPGIVLTLLGFAIAWINLKPAPPATLVMAAGPADGAYYAFAQKYRNLLSEKGVELEILETAGSLENYQKLASGEADWAIIQGGLHPQVPKNLELESLASVYFEPVWIFYRSEEVISDMRQLNGLKIAVGRDGSGTQAIAKLMLQENGITSDDAEWFAVGGKAAANRLRNHDLDLAFFVASPRSEIVLDLISEPGIRLLSFHRGNAYSRRHPFLHTLTLDRGVIDLETDLPPEDVKLLAPAAILVCRGDMHEAFIPLILSAAKRIHGDRSHSILGQHKFPSRDYVQWRMNPSADRFLQFGPPFLQRYLPYWIASLIDRWWVFMLPALGLLLPLVKLTPSLYQWRVRSSIYNWYEVLRGIESDQQGVSDTETYKQHLATLEEMERELDAVQAIPLPYMQEFYNLRLHIEFVKRQTQTRRKGILAKTLNPTPETKN